MSNREEQALRDILEIVGKAPAMPKLQKIHNIATNAIGDTDEPTDTDTTPETATPTGWDKTAEDCRNCRDWADCNNDNQEDAQLQGDDFDNGENMDAEGADCFENMYD